MSDKTKVEKAPKRDAERTRQAILQAALVEYSEHGFSGARIDRIAKNARISKPMIYDYFGDKDALYAAALREAYVQIREGESELHLDELPPETAIRSLVQFTMAHFREKPWFISMLNTENLRGGKTVREIQDANEIQSQLLVKLSDLLKRGAADGTFRKDVDPVGLYIHIASLCYFPVSNAHTLRAVFGPPIDDAWLDQHVEEASEMVIRFLKAEA
ncbi:TetR/AcrR family transcriptional regulator [Cohaesibacter celericrescens]|uniref:TetR/AcrR family transcriptional regulator n=1 Tax=Cohaesibacter celericrescens TaxID=2067669 RepID=A0A2N5XNH1_9HYPH|nr:TetR/AcrR family transcriptional regulator [Cohaesibacter celericrescens]PLW75968.1 TetR/AcrR family transcriptional regulator [Cohaesibacter celericrescens]